MAATNITTTHAHANSACSSISGNLIVLDAIYNDLKVLCLRNKQASAQGQSTVSRSQSQSVTPPEQEFIIMGGYAINKIFANYISRLKDDVAQHIYTSDLDIKVFVRPKDLKSRGPRGYEDIMHDLIAKHDPVANIKDSGVFPKYVDNDCIYRVLASKYLDMSVHVNRYKCIDAYLKYVDAIQNCERDTLSFLSRANGQLYAAGELYASRDLSVFNTVHMFVLVHVGLHSGKFNNRIPKGAKLLVRSMFVLQPDFNNNSALMQAANEFKEILTRRGSTTRSIKSVIASLKHDKTTWTKLKQTIEVAIRDMSVIFNSTTTTLKVAGKGKDIFSFLCNYENSASNSCACSQSYPAMGGVTSKLRTWDIAEIEKLLYTEGDDNITYDSFDLLINEFLKETNPVDLYGLWEQNRLQAQKLQRQLYGLKHKLYTQTRRSTSYHRGGNHDHDHGRGGRDEVGSKMTKSKMTKSKMTKSKMTMSTVKLSPTRKQKCSRTCVANSNRIAHI
jgi:hypothetical protein